MSAQRKVSPATTVVHGLHGHHAGTHDLVPPIHLTSTFVFKNADHGAGCFAGTDEGYIYTRLGNPTLDLLGQKIAAIEGAETGLTAASGMAAIAAVAMSFCRPGDNLVACNSLYGGTFALFHRHLREFGIEPRLLPSADCRDEKRILAAADERTRLFFIETPANPTLDVFDISLWARAAKKRGVPLAVDNTFPSPWLSSPLALGADIVIHSGTKYLSGHGDIIGGMIAGSKDLMCRIKKDYLNNFGPTMSPFTAWLFLRGIKTLAVRMEKHCDNAEKVAAFLEKHPKVTKIWYPGLPSHPDHALAKKQMKRSGAMISFEVKGGLDAGKKLMDNVKLCTLAVSLGDCETLIQHPASMTHASIPPADRLKAGITDGLIRLSVGIEEAEDIIADLDETMKLI